jgi:hypothetical protein
VVARSEVVVAGVRVGQPVPDDGEHRVADGDDGAFLAAAADQAPVALAEEGIGSGRGGDRSADSGGQPRDALTLYAAATGAGEVAAGLSTGALMLATVLTELAVPRLLATFWLSRGHDVGCVPARGTRGVTGDISITPSRGIRQETTRGPTRNQPTPTLRSKFEGAGSCG